VEFGIERGTWRIIIDFLIVGAASSRDKLYFQTVIAAEKPLPRNLNPATRIP
jgi:hypothetical protein